MNELNELLERLEDHSDQWDRARCLDRVLRNIATEAEARGSIDLDGIVNFLRIATSH